jgi:N-acetylneuraminic acid mutarotase
VWVNQLEVDEWSAGPAMSISRYFHGCASFKDQHDGKNKIIVAGGVTSINGKDKTLKSSEIFDGEEWQRGPDLPQEMCCGQIVTSLNNEKVLWIGGGDIVGEGNGISYSIYELSNALDEWIELPQKMITGRIFFAAVDVPDMC